MYVRIDKPRCNDKPLRVDHLISIADRPGKAASELHDLPVFHNHIACLLHARSRIDDGSVFNNQHR